jgi:uncharacterized protein YdeI (YjbR/CyaY-like superfamily)
LIHHPAMAPDSPDACDAWFRGLSDFAKPICEKLREIVHRAAPDLEEVIRWRMVCFKGESLIFCIGAFKAHVNFVVARGAELEDPQGLFQRDVDPEGNHVVLRSVADIKPGPLRDLIHRAVKLHASPRPKSKAQRPDIPLPEVLRQALAKDKVARQHYEALAPSQRREYNEWIAGAKQEATVQRRIEKALAKLAAGEGLNDKYRSR